MTIGFVFSSGNDAMIAEARRRSSRAGWRSPCARGRRRTSARPWRGTRRSRVGVPVSPVAWFVPRRQCSRKSRMNWPPLPAMSGPPTRAVGSARRTPSIGVVVQLVELLGRAAPVADVRLVPHLPVPLLHFGAAVPLDAVLRPLVDELAPLRVVLRRVGPAGVDLVVLAPSASTGAGTAPA